MQHAKRVQPTVFFEGLAHTAAFGIGNIAEGHAEKFAAGGAAFLDGQMVVAAAGERRKHCFHGVTSVLVRVVVAKAAKREQQIHDARRHFAQPRFELRQLFATFVQPAGFEAGVIGHHRPGGGQIFHQVLHEFGSGVSGASGQIADMLQLGIGGLLDVEGVLKGYLLIRADAVKQWNRGADGLEVEVADGIFELTEKRGQRRAVNVGLAGDRGGALDGLIVRQFHLSGNIGDFLDAALQEAECFLAAAIEGENAGLRQERPAAVVQRAGIGAVTLRADLNIGMRFRADDTLHGVDLIRDVAGHGGDGLGDFCEREKFLGINGTMPDELVVDVGEETFAELDAGAGEHERLERDVGQVNFLLKAGGGFHFDQIPGIAGDRHEDVGAGVAAAVREGGFVNGPTLFERFLRAPDGAVEIAGSGINLDAAGKQLLGEFANLVALIEDGLQRLVRNWNLVFGVVAKPEQLGALPPHQVGGLGKGWLAGGWHGEVFGFLFGLNYLKHPLLFRIPIDGQTRLDCFVCEHLYHVIFFPT